MIIKLWQCGQCGITDRDRALVEQCCGMKPEGSYKCSKCGKLYSFNPENHKCSSNLKTAENQE